MNRQLSLKELLPELNENQRKLLLRLILEKIPVGVNTDNYKYEDSAQDFMLGYVQACIEIKRAITELIEGSQ